MFKKKMITRKKGVLTIEAAIVVPLSVFTVYFLLCFMNIIMVYDTVQSSINNTANIVGANSFVISESGIADITGSTGGSDPSMGAEIIDSLNNIILGNGNMSDLKNQLTTFDANEVAKFLSSLRSEGDYFKNFMLNITNVFLNLAFSGQIDEKNLNATLSSATMGIAYECLLNDLGGGNPNIKTIDKKLDYLGIVGGIDGLNFDKTNFTIINNPELQVIVDYQFEIKNPFFNFKPIKITQRAVVRPWIGK